MIYGRYHNLLSSYNHILPSPQKLFPKDPKYREKPALPAGLRYLQIAATNVIDFGTTPLSSLMGMRSRQVTNSNGVVEQMTSLRKLPNTEDGDDGDNDDDDDLTFSASLLSVLLSKASEAFCRSL